MVAAFGEAIVERDRVAARLQAQLPLRLQNAVAQQAEPCRRFPQAFDRAVNFESFGAVDLARQGKIAQIDFIAAARQTHRQCPNLYALTAQEWNDARGLAAIFIAVGDQQDFSLTPFADLRDSSLQRRLDIGFIALRLRAEIARRNIFARQRLPLGRASKSQKSGAGVAALDPARRVENLQRLFPSLLTDAARQVDAKNNIESGCGAKDARIDQRHRQRHQRRAPDENWIDRHSLAKRQQELQPEHG